MKNVPDIRFKGFEDEWERLVVSDLLQVNKTLNTDNRYGREDVLSVSDECGIVNQIKYLGRSYAGKSVLKYKVVKPNQIVYTKSPLKDKPYGIVKQSDIYGIVSSLYAVYDIIGNCIPSYIQWYFEPYYRINKYFRPLVNKGAKNTINISDTNAVTGTIYIPKIVEQTIISSYLEFLSKHINDTTKKIASLKQLKSACLIYMFPQQGETVPRVRFKGFNGEWKKKKLKSFASRITRKNSKLESKLPVTISALNGIIEQTMFFNNIVASSNLSGYYLMKKGEFAYNKSYSCGFPFGAVKRMDRYEMGALSNLYIVFKLEDTVCDDYILYLFETSTWHKEVSMRASEGARNHGLLNIGAEDFLDIDIWVPNDKAEQYQIASYFRNLDIQISEQEKRLEKLKQIKAACLDKMFV